MNKQLFILTVLFALMFVAGVVWFIYDANTGSRSDPPPGPASLFDRDLDGLTDAQEQKIGTNPIEADSDFDGLTDKQELEQHTNPLEVDTDGDGFIDGVEVQGGYNPLGPGFIK